MIAIQKHTSHRLQGARFLRREPLVPTLLLRFKCSLVPEEKDLNHNIALAKHCSLILKDSF